VVKDNFGANLDQIEMLKDLYRLMDAKVRSSRRGNVDAFQGQSNVGGRGLHSSTSQLNLSRI
jgi:hypothetical protein